MSNMSHNSAIKDQEQILGQSIDGGRADSGGAEQVVQFDENERPAMQQALVQQEESQQLDMVQQPDSVQQLDHKQSEQPQITTEAKQPRTEQSQVQQLQTQQPQTHQALQPLAPQQQPQQQEHSKQHTLSDAEVQSLCAETIEARDRAYCIHLQLPSHIHHHTLINHAL